MADMIIQNFEGLDRSDFFIDTSGSDVFPASPGLEVFPELSSADMLPKAAPKPGGIPVVPGLGPILPGGGAGVPGGGREPLSPDELSKLGVKLGKSHLNGKDLRVVEELLSGKILFSAEPEDEEKKKEFSVNRILKDLGALVVFTNVDACKEYLNKYSKGRFGTRLTIAGLPIELIRQEAANRNEKIYIDPDPSGQRQFAGIDGKTDTVMAVRL